jgi:D-sedoheptulose 7-phosphate isomerase
MEAITQYLDSVAASLRSVPQDSLNQVTQALWDTYQRDGTIFICGNGGSAATASHFACDMLKLTIQPHARRVRAHALTDNIPVITAWANDLSYESVFVEQLINYYRPGDLLFAISGSGNSPNVLRAVEWAKQQNAPTVGITGFNGGKLATMVCHSIHCDNHIMPQVEDIHSAICHGLAVWMRDQIAQDQLVLDIPSVIHAL